MLEPTRERRPAPRPLASRLVLVAVMAAAALGGCDRIREKLGGKAAGDGGAPIGSEPIGAISSFLGTDGFEGEITMALSGTQAKGAPKTMVYGIKRPKLRVDITSQAPALAANPMFSATTAVIVDPAARKAWALMPAQKRAVVLDLDRAQEMGSLGKGVPQGPTTPPKIVKTGKTDVVAGFTCEEWHITDERSDNDVCVAEGVTWFDPMSMGMSAAELGWGASLAGANRFPLRVVSKDKGGRGTFRMEATKVEKKALDAARFVVPADYQVIDPFAMIGNLKGLPGMPSGGFPMPPPNAKRPR